MSQKFPRDRRLLTAADFQRVFETPLKSSDALFTVLARPREEPAVCSRLGLAIAKKQLKRAVDRNRIKRLSREVFRQLKAPQQSPAMDFVVMVRSRARASTQRELAEALQRHFQRLISKAGRA